MKLIPFGEKISLDELLPGTIFAFDDDCIAVKSEYRSGGGFIEAVIIGSGEMFWGGAKSVIEQNSLMVQPLEIAEVAEDAVPVVHGRWKVLEYDGGEVGGYAPYIDVECSNCGLSVGLEQGQYGWAYGDPFPWKCCPFCGAKMDGGNDNA